MSLIITVYTNEGIVMASDSRTTYSITEKVTDGTINTLIGVQTTDNTYKTFMCNNRIGLSTCGAATINGVPITGYIEDFIARKVDNNIAVESVAQELLDYFSAFTPIPNTNFIVAGYNNDDARQHICRVFISSGDIIPTNNTTIPGVLWDGETEVFKRLVKDVALKNTDGTYTDLVTNTTGYEHFTMQDAIDYAIYAIDVTIKTMFFQNCVKTVGGPIDILAIKPSGAFWIQRKELHA